MFKKKNLKNTLGIIGICILVCAAVLGIVGVVSDGFNDFELREVNEDNLINVDNYVSTLDGYKADGLKVKVNDDGVIAITGENETDTDVEIEVCSVTLKADEYTLSCEAKGIDDKTYYLKAVDSTNNKSVIVDSSKGETFKIEAEATYTIYIVVCDGEEIDTTFKPVLVDDDEAGSFFVFSND